MSTSVNTVRKPGRLRRYFMRNGGSDIGARAINQRNFEVGPEPKTYPAWAELEATPKPEDATAVVRATLRANAGLIAVTSVTNLAAFLGSALVPWALGVLLDSGLERGLTAALIPGALLTMAMIVFRASGAFAEPVAMVSWMRGTFGWQDRMSRVIVGVRGGGRQKIPAGEVVSAITSDTQKIGTLLYSVGTSISAAITFLAIAVIMLVTNLKLGLLVTFGLPVVVIGMTFIVKPLQTKLEENREQRGKLTSLATDAVVGLRVLRGVGGEDMYNDRYRAQSEEVLATGIEAAKLQALMMGLNAFAPAMFTAIVVGVGLLDVSVGRMSFGSLAAFFGYTAYLGIPIARAADLFQNISDARVAAGRIEKVMAIEPLTSDVAVDASVPQPDWANTTLTDVKTGVHLRPGMLTAFVSDDPTVSAAIAERLARVDDEWEIVASWPGSAQVVDLRSIPLAEVRENVVLSDAIAQIFQGRLRSNVNAQHADTPIARDLGEQMADTGDGTGLAHRRHELNPDAVRDDDLMAAVAVADGKDIVYGLEGGFDGIVDERGRSLSGGQRQRVALARAVASEAPILVLVEPTSAVDSHTETRIAERLRENRAGRTTLVVTSSPIVLGQVDEVVLVDSAGEIARGTHEKLNSDLRYIAIVHRASGEEE